MSSVSKISKSVNSIIGLYYIVVDDDNKLINIGRILGKEENFYIVQPYDMFLIDLYIRLISKETLLQTDNVYFYDSVKDFEEAVIYFRKEHERILELRERRKK